jgi:ribose transport system substrate-binding protein
MLGWVAADAKDYAVRVANLMGEKMNGKGVVAVTQFSLNDLENVVVEEFTKEMNAKYPDIVVLSPEMEGGDQPLAIGVATTILQVHPEVTAAFGTTGNSPSTWAKAAEAVGKKPGEIIIVGMDYIRQNLDYVKSGEVYALVGQPLYEELYKAVELLAQNLKGEPVEYDNIYPAPIITIENVDKYYEYADRVDAQE